MLILGHILKSYYLLFLRWFSFREILFCTSPNTILSILLTIIQLLRTKTHTDWGGKEYTREGFKEYPGSRSFDLIREILKRYSPTSSTWKRYLFPTKHWILEQDGVGINWVLKTILQMPLRKTKQKKNTV